MIILIYNNGASGDNTFIPLLIGYRDNSIFGGVLGIQANANSALDVVGNKYAMIRFVTRLNDPNIAAQAAVVNTPLFAWENGTNDAYMQMLANGNLGIGTLAPSTQLHTTGGVRFQGLLNQPAYNRVVLADGNGNLGTQVYTPGASLSCGTTNFLSKVTGANALGCSQVFDNGTNVGIGTTAPSAQFHTTGTVRFQGLTVNNAFNNIVVADANGNLATRVYSPGAVLSCANVNYVPKVTGANAIGCSQIFDNGTSVGIGTNAGFTYTGYPQTIITNTLVPVGSTITLKVNGITSSVSYVVTSDGRFKQGVKTIEKAMDKIAALNGVSYSWKAAEFKSLGYKFDDTKQLGFIAQDLMKVLPEAVIVDENGYYAVNYTMVIPLLTEALKEQQQTIADQGKKITEIETSLRNSLATSNSSNAAVLNNAISNDNKVAKVYQNTPNPFSQSTTIAYYLPTTSGNSSIIVFDLSGKLLKTIPLTQKGEGSIIINGNEFQSGMYVYSLVIDGQEIESKRMILTQ